ncbi:thioredoxin 1 [Entomortierella parvispora]|uniref:Thioredoxin 1 n=1 Tax=Entomortierella parvispora TaxID=205924 RepID=A0A9P3HAG5_9FUNG|nr:thioredoxin 1 [Entomortierella parvispora]
MNGLRLLTRNVNNIARTGAQVRAFQSSSLVFTGKTHDATDDTFKTLVSSKEPILVDFHADWCRPCHMLDPIIRKAVADSGAVTLLRVDVDECPQVASKFQIASIPCVMAFKDGEPVEKFVGALPKNAVVDFVTKHAGRA